jgi:hypothetical protein
VQFGLPFDVMISPLDLCKQNSLDMKTSNAKPSKRGTLSGLCTTVLSFGLLVFLCSSSCSRHGSCPAYGSHSVQSQKQSIELTKLELTPALEEQQ